MAGLFITFEGGEGSGKTSQINRLAQTLANTSGLKVVTTREPGGTPEAEKIRNLLVQREGGNWSPLSEVLLLFAARVLHVENVIKPALENGKIVISDRFTDSTRAYQGYGHGMELPLIEKINETVLGNFQPDLTILLDIQPEAGLNRSERRLAGEQFMGARNEDRFEKLELEFHKRLRSGFLEIAKNNPKRCVVLDATKPMDELSAEILKIVQGKL
jgi:dTMP kinase